MKKIICIDIDNVILSTDSKKIALIAESYGVKIDHLRPDYLASDASPEILSWKHEISYYQEKRSFDTNDFDVSFARGLSLEDGVATLTDFTASIIGEELSTSLLDFDNQIKEILICGGGRKNKILLKKIKNFLPNVNLKNIDDYKINGDFVESQAFAFLAIRSVLKLPISFPSTTGCSNPCSGGVLINS